jgi:AcrR family transcriptional regulator
MKERIQIKAMELFMQYGIRSISMDDIASQLGISKKTIYQYFADKNELVSAVVDADINDLQSRCNDCGLHADNAIHEIFLTMDMIQKFLINMNPMLLYDLRKFHQEAYQKWVEHKNNFLLVTVHNNIRQGIEEGFYRPEINADILSKFRLESMLIPFNIEVFPPAEYTLVDVTIELLENFLYGMVTQKGYELTTKYKHERAIHNKK